MPTPDDAFATAPAEPLIGWRLWRVSDSELRSWGLSYCWTPGVNDARCLAPISGRPAAHRAPGIDCTCGFWALFGPIGCLRLVHDIYGSETVVLGLIRAWGEIAVHGQEGFRAQHAAVACLFSDLILRPALNHPAAHREVRQRMLTRIAGDFGAPCLPMRSAAEHGVLEEIGADSHVMPSVEAWMSGR